MPLEKQKTERLEHSSPPKTLDPVLLNKFCFYIKERESIRIKKEAGEPWPWTEDPILQNYKFTNVYRKDDKTSKYFIDNFYSKMDHRPTMEIALNCAIFRYFGSIDFAKHVGWTNIDNGFDEKKLLEKVHDTQKRGIRVFTGAYVITNAGIPKPKEEVVVTVFLRGFYTEHGRIEKALKTNIMANVFDVLKDLRGFGGSGFMAKEAIQDMAFTRLLKDAHDFDTFTPVGPGAVRGLNRLYNHGKHLESSIPLKTALEYISELRRQVKIHTGFALTAHDIQFSLCEIDKYCRVFNGEGRPRSMYKQPEEPVIGFF